MADDAAHADKTKINIEEFRKPKQAKPVKTVGMFYNEHRAYDNVPEPLTTDYGVDFFTLERIIEKFKELETIKFQAHLNAEVETLEMIAGLYYSARSRKELLAILKMTARQLQYKLKKYGLPGVKKRAGLRYYNSSVA
jgi:hypothetical protein